MNITASEKQLNPVSNGTTLATTQNGVPIYETDDERNQTDQANRKARWAFEAEMEKQCGPHWHQDTGSLGYT